MTPAEREKHFRAVAPGFMRRLLGDFPQLGELDAAAVFGNGGGESKGLTDDQEDKPTVPGSRGGRNWMQWTGVRREQFEAFSFQAGVNKPEDLKPGIAVQLMPGSIIDLGDGVTIQVTHP